MAAQGKDISYEDLSALKDNYKQLKAQGHPDADAARETYKRAQNTFNTAQRRNKSKGITSATKAADASVKANAEQIVAKMKPAPVQEKPSSKLTLTPGFTEVPYRSISKHTPKAYLPPEQGPSMGTRESQGKVTDARKAKIARRDESLEAMKTRWSAEAKAVTDEKIKNRGEGNVGQQLAPYKPLTRKERDAWRKNTWSSMDKSKAAKEAAARVAAGPAKDKFGFTQQQHDEAFETARHRWWSTGGRKVYDPISGNIKGTRGEVQRLDQAYQKSRAFTHPAQFMKEEHEKLAKLVGKGKQ